MRPPVRRDSSLTAVSGTATAAMCLVLAGASRLVRPVIGQVAIGAAAYGLAIAALKWRPILATVLGRAPSVPPPDLEAAPAAARQGAIALLLINYGLGGAEKRFAFLFRHRMATGAGETLLFVNEILYTLLLEYHLLSPSSHVVVLPEPKWLACFLRQGLPPTVVRAFVVVSRVNMMWQLARVLHQWQPEIVHAVLDGVRYVPLMRRYSPETIFVSTVPNSNREVFESRQFVRGLAASTHVDCLDRAVADLVVARTDLSPDCVTPTPASFIDFGRIQNKPVLRKAQQVVFSSRLVPFKHPLMFVDMVDRLTRGRHCADVEFLILGDGELLDEVRVRATACQARGVRLAVRGFVPDPCDVLRESLIFVQMMEGAIPASQSLLEAMALECAVVTAAFPGVEVIVPPGAGLTCAFNTEAYAASVAWLLDHPDDARAMGRAARRHVEAHFTIDQWETYMHESYAAARSRVRPSESSGRRPSLIRVYVETLLW